MVSSNEYAPESGHKDPYEHPKEPGLPLPRTGGTIKVSEHSSDTPCLGHDTQLAGRRQTEGT